MCEGAWSNELIDVSLWMLVFIKDLQGCQDRDLWECLVLIDKIFKTGTYFFV